MKNANQSKTATMRAKEVPVVREADVLVVGGGYAGFGAALCAARNGAKTIIVERESALGGLATLGYVSLTFSYIEGIGYELFSELKKRNAVKGRFIDPEKTKVALEEMLLKENVEILYNSAAADAIVEDGVIKGAIVQNRAGFQAIMAKRVVDASGDGDISAWAGAPFECGSPEHDGYNQSTSLVVRIGNINNKVYQEALNATRKDGGISSMWQDKIEEACKNGDFPYMIDRRLNWAVVIPGRDPEHQEMCQCYPHSRKCRNLDPFDLTRQIIEQRKQAEYTIAFCRKYLPGYENAWLIDSAPMLGVRDSRRIVGEYVLTAEDVANNRRFDDVVIRDMHHFDVHHPTTVGHIKHIKRKGPDGSEQKLYTMPGSYREVPYRCLVPLKVDNLLVAGRCFSADFMAQATVRLVLACLNMGQAAGTAAALSIKDGVTPRKLDVKKLQRRLVEMGFSLDKAPDYGVSGFSTSKEIAKDDLLIPKNADDESSAVGVRNAGKYNSKGGGYSISENEDKRIAMAAAALKERGGYTNTGGDVGTYLE